MSSNKNINLIDIGANLTHESFKHDLEEVIEKSKDIGITSIIVTGACEKGSQEALELTKKYPGFLYSTSGIHPHHAKNFNSNTIAILKEVAADNSVKAIGETGLDYFRNYSTQQQQEHSFESHIELAIETAMPLFLHQRDAHSRFFEIVKSYRDQLNQVVVHCFTGTKAELYDYLDLDLYIGITGWICDERRGHHLHEFINEIPLDRIMIETDAPYLLPRSLPKKPSSRRNEPFYLPEVLNAVAKCYNLTSSEMACLTTKNAKKFFKLDT